MDPWTAAKITELREELEMVLGIPSARWSEYRGAAGSPRREYIANLREGIAFLKSHAR